MGAVFTLGSIWDKAANLVSAHPISGSPSGTWAAQNVPSSTSGHKCDQLEKEEEEESNQNENRRGASGSAHGIRSFYTLPNSFVYGNRLREPIITTVSCGSGSGNICK
jgi:hypothetical protein